MSERYTVRHVRAAFDDMCAAARENGIDTDAWELIAGGGSTDYKLVLRPAGSVGNFGSIGRSARDAFRAIEHMTYAFQIVRNASGPGIAYDYEGRRTIAVTRGQLDAWAGADLSDDDVSAIDEALPHSSFPETVATIAESVRS